MKNFTIPDGFNAIQIHAFGADGDKIITNGNAVVQSGTADILAGDDALSFYVKSEVAGDIVVGVTSVNSAGKTISDTITVTKEVTVVVVPSATAMDFTADAPVNL